MNALDFYTDLRTACEYGIGADADELRASVRAILRSGIPDGMVEQLLRDAHAKWLKSPSSQPSGASS